ncbi:MAG: hypothetical protein WD066_00730 [Planctomycetaceae bacterium]
MRQLASFSFEARSSDDLSATRATDALEQIEGWLRSKGRLADDGRSAILHDGRVAMIERATVTGSCGKITELVLTEPRPDGWFRTAIAIAEADGNVAVSVSLGAAAEALTPVYVDVRCPRIVRDLLAPPSQWTYQGTSITSAPVECSGQLGGDEFISRAWDDARSVPIVAVSDEYGSVLHPRIVENLASDLAGLAIVVRLDPPASWRVTQRKGKEWSCFSGAIRLLWPGITADALPYRHPLWTPRRLLSLMTDTESAAERIRRELRRRILGQSAFSVSEPTVFSAIRRAAREEELSALRAKAAGHSNYEALAEEYFNAAARANVVIADRDAEIEELRAKIRALQYALQSKRGEIEEVEPDTETPPATVEEAVLMAMDKLSDDLVFGSAVTDGVGTLAQDAGPPYKVLSYLQLLGEFTRTRRQGSLGTTTIKWLQDRGAIASAESETVRNSPKEQEARTWDDGDGESRAFDLHLKPSDGTAPDRCVRIYFAYNEARRKTVVGWVGRHP